MTQGIEEAPGVGLVRNLEIGLLDPQSAYDLARRIDRPDADAVMLACGNWSTLPAIERLERDLGKPAISAASAMMWRALHLAGVHAPIRGYGRLLAGAL